MFRMILNATAAYEGIVIYLSMVLFYGAPDFLANNSKMGLPQPGVDDYPYIDVEPRTGAVFYANASMQICSPLHSLPVVGNVTVNASAPGLFNLSDGLMVHIYLVTFSDALTDGIADNFKSNLGLGDTLRTVSVVGGWCALVLFLMWAFVTVFVCGVNRGFKSRDALR